MSEKQSKTEKATPQKRKKEREKGNLGKSKELTTFFSLLGLSLFAFIFSENMVYGFAVMLENVFVMTENETEITAFLGETAKMSFTILIPALVIGTFFHGVDYAIQTNFLFSLKIIKPDIKRINPMNFFQKLFSRKTIIDIIRSAFMVLMLGGIAFFVLRSQVELLQSSIYLPYLQTVENIYGVFQTVFIFLLILLLFVGAIDFAYQKWENEQKIKMKKEEVKDERKNTEGNPETKKRRKQMLYEFLQGDVSRVVPDGTVVINNPTHISVVLRYKKGVDPAPLLIAKGEDQMALYIRRLADQHEIPQVRNIPLARAIYSDVDVNDYIDEDMYKAVVQVLKALYEEGKLEL